jgi:hypothetical protein
MRSLGKTKLSDTRLQTSEQGELMNMDSHIPLSIEDIIPQGSKTTKIETSELRTPEEIKNDIFWKKILEFQNK